VAPDAFDIIDVGVVKGLTNDQRRNLGSIAKILQFAASNKGVSRRRLLVSYIHVCHIEVVVVVVLIVVVAVVVAGSCR